MPLMVSTGLMAGLQPDVRDTDAVTSSLYSHSRQSCRPQLRGVVHRWLYFLLLCRTPCVGVVLSRDPLASMGVSAV